MQRGYSNLMAANWSRRRTNWVRDLVHLFKRPNMSFTANGAIALRSPLEIKSGQTLTGDGVGPWHWTGPANGVALVVESGGTIVDLVITGSCVVSNSGTATNCTLNNDPIA